MEKAELAKANYKSFVNKQPSSDTDRDLKTLKRLRNKMWVAYKAIGKEPPYKDGKLL